MKNNPALSSLITGIIMNILNLIMCCVFFFGDSFLFGGIFLIFPILGIINGVKGIKLGQGALAIAGLVLNIFATLGGLGFTILGIISKFMALA